MKILLYQSASDVDAIAMLGFAQVLSQHHQVDVLVLKKQAYLFEGAVSGSILHFEAYPIPQHSTQRGLAVKIDQHFGKAYDACLHTYIPAHAPRYFEEQFDKDRQTYFYDIAAVIGLTLPSRYYLQHTFVLDSAEQAATHTFAKNINIARPILLVDDCEGFNQPAWFNNGLLNELRTRGYMLAGRGPQHDINISSLNLKQINLFFQHYCAGGLFLYNTLFHTAISADADLTKKKIILCCPFDTCNMSRMTPSDPEKYSFVVVSRPTSGTIEAVFGGQLPELPSPVDVYVEKMSQIIDPPKPKKRVDLLRTNIVQADIKGASKDDLFLWIF